MDPNYDPRDDREIRPQVGFRLKAGAYDRQDLYRQFRTLQLAYHDMMLFDATDGEVPGTIRFAWEAKKSTVDATAEWLQGLPYVLHVFPSYGGPIEGAED